MGRASEREFGLFRGLVRGGRTASAGNGLSGSSVSFACASPHEPPGVGFFVFRGCRRGVPRAA